MKMPEPHRIVQGFGMEAEYLYTQEQMREALASNEAVMRMAKDALISVIDGYDGPLPYMSISGGTYECVDFLEAIKALEDALK